MVIKFNSAKHRSFMRFLVSALIVCVSLENLKVLDIIGAALKPVHFVMIIASAYCFMFKKKHATDIFVGMMFLIIPVFPLTRINDINEWFKSYMIYFIICVFMMTALRYVIAEMQLNYSYHLKLLVYIIAFVEVLGIIQFICMNFFGYFFLQNFWGSFQFHFNSFGESNGFLRAYSLFHEPSFFALVCNTSLAILLFLNNDLFSTRKKVFLILLSLISVVCSIAVSGIVISMVLIVLYLLLKSKRPEKILFYLIIAFMAFLAIWFFTDLLDPLDRIADELQTEGTSGYERMVTPFLYVEKVFEHYPIFGRGLGQEGDVDLIGIIGRYTGIQNSLIGIVSTFGLSVLFFYIPAIVYSIRKTKENRFWLILLVNIIGIYASTGAWCSLDTFLFLVLTVAVGAVPKHDLKSN